MDEDEADDDSGGSSQIAPGKRAIAVVDSALSPSADDRQMALDAIEDSRNQIDRLERIITEAQLEMNRWKTLMAETEEFLKDNIGF